MYYEQCKESSNEAKVVNSVFNDFFIYFTTAFASHICTC